MPDHHGSVLVVGSINTDHVVIADVFPAPGQTVRGTAARSQTGGKGANQAVAAALAGAAVRLFAQVGSDPEGGSAKDALAGRGVDVSAVAVIAGKPTGTAWITVAEQDNTIVVVPGANEDWPDRGDPLSGAGRTAAVVLAQLEIPQDIVLGAAAASTGILVLNAAPAADLSDALLARCDVLVVNEHELAVVARMPEPFHSPAAFEQAHHALRGRGVGAVITTLGAAGALVTDGHGRSTQIPALPAPVVDTTGAGDAFTGVLAAKLAAGVPLLEAARWASVAGSYAVRKAGAQESYPDLAALDREMGALSRDA